jgi:hypothetical protein
MSETTTVTQAPAPSTETPVYQEPQKVLNGMTGAERREWQLTGKLPEPKVLTTKEDSSTSTKPPKEESAPSSSDADKAKSAPAPEAGPKQEKTAKRTDESKRVQELLNERYELRKEIEALKQGKTATKAEPPPAKPAEVKGLEAPVKPKQADFKDWDAYEAARDKYYEDVAEYKATKKIQEAEQDRVNRQNEQRLQAELAEGRKRYQDFDQVVLPAANTIFEDPQIAGIVKHVINASPVLTDLLYAIGGDKANLDDFIQKAKSDPLAAVRMAVITEQLVMQELKKTKDGKVTEPERNEKGQFQASPEKKVTSAPPPPKEVGGKGTAPADPVQGALQRGDYKAYEAAQNAAELEKWKAKHPTRAAR